MTAPTEDATRVLLLPEVQQLAKDVRLKDGKIALPEDAFLKWKGEHQRLAPAERERYAEHLTSLAVRLQREGGANAAEAIAQLFVLAAALLGHARAAAGFRAAGVGWVPRTNGATGCGWGSKG